MVHLYVSGPSVTSKLGGPEWVWLGSVALREEVEDETKVAVQYLQRCMGFKVFMCTGDNPRTAARVAATLGIPIASVVAQQTPEAKVRFIRSLSQPTNPRESQESLTDRDQNSNSSAHLLRRELEEQPVCCMVGDGLNDSPALSEAALGVAFGVGNSIPVAAAEVAVGGRSWTELVDLFKIARETRSVIRW